jgi:drug/metabolite transporter superfamily protein YnfA
MPPSANRQPLPLEVVAVWTLFAVDAAAMLVTYSRLPARELYHVSGSGLTGGLSRVLVFSNFSTALVAIAILALLADRTPDRRVRVAALGGVILCAAVFWPGVVKEADLDARPVNALSALGVLVAVVLTWLASRDGTRWNPRRRGDLARIAVAVAAVVLALPWISAEAGFFLDGRPAVHHGHHHGLDGVLLLLSALLLSRAVPAMRRRKLRIATGMYLALMAAYGFAIAANDFWFEQVVKRRWTSWTIPNVLYPKASIAWALIVLGAAVLYAIAARASEAAL